MQKPFIKHAIFGAFHCLARKTLKIMKMQEIIEIMIPVSRVCKTLYKHNKNNYFPVD